MTGKIITPFKLDAARIAELAEAGVDLDTNFDSLSLPEPQYGEQSIGVLTEEEAQLFVAFYNTQQKFEDLHRNTLGAILRRAGETISKSDRSKALASQLSRDKLSEFETEEDEKEFCRVGMLLDHLKAALFFQIAERLDCHSFKIGIRSKRRIVKSGRRVEGMVQE